MMPLQRGDRGDESLTVPHHRPELLAKIEEEGVKEEVE